MLLSRRGVPLSYSLRNLWARKLTTALTAAGMSLVVFVFAAVLMLDAGLRQTLVDTGSDDNAVVIRKGAGTEMQSGIERMPAALIESQAEVAFGAGGTLFASKELVVLITLPKRDSASGERLHWFPSFLGASVAACNLSTGVL